MPGEVPSGWTYRRLLDVVAIANGQVDPTASLFRHRPLIAPNHVESGTGRLLEVQTAAEQGAISGKYEVAPGDVVYSKIRPYLRKVWLADRSGLCSADMYPIRAGADVESGFLLALLLGDHFSRFAEAVSARTGIPKINREELGGYHIVLPPLPEQKKIAAILSSVDEAIQATQAVIDQTRRVKEGLLQDLLTRGIGHTRFKQTEIGEIPESWVLTTVGRTLRDIVAGRSPSAPDEPATGERWGVLKVSAVGHGEFLPGENKTLPVDFQVRDEHMVSAGDVLITRANTAVLVGACCRVPQREYRLMLCDKTLRLEPMNGVITPEFLYELLGSPRARRYFARVATGSSASMKNLSQAKIREFEIPLPPLAEQGTIVGVLSAVNEQLTFGEAALKGLYTTKTGLLQDLLTGKVRVTP